MKFVNNITSSFITNKKAFLYAYPISMGSDLGFFSKVRTFIEEFRGKKAIIRISRNDDFKPTQLMVDQIDMREMVSEFSKKVIARDAKIATESKTLVQ